MKYSVGQKVYYNAGDGTVVRTEITATIFRVTAKEKFNEYLVQDTGDDGTAIAEEQLFATADEAFDAS